ncbi:nuclease Le1 [Clavulina sp. PMI_390]|nr:nuclease Le1 [Clavulina sp. PMI_390]
MFSPASLATGALLFASATSVHAWGNSGHETIGYIAQAFLGPKTLAFVQKTLDSSYSGQLGPAAIWADSIKYSTGWTWSQALHYIDANDSPLSGSCSVSDSRDCDGDCILTALTNYTSRVVNTALSVSEQDIALKFITHFIGDIGQPLHCEAYEVGGNDIDEKFDGTSTELHAVWDTYIPEKTIKLNHSNSITTYASDLVTKIKTGTYKSLAASWINCTNPTLHQRRSLDLDERSFIPDSTHDMPMLSNRASTTDLECPLEWAKDSNSYVCSTGTITFARTSALVFTGYTASDLGTTYYTNNAPIVDLQIAKSGYRLAAWLNTLFDGTAMPSS